MRQDHIDEGTFKILAVKDDNKKFALASTAIEWGNKFMLTEGLIK